MIRYDWKKKLKPQNKDDSSFEKININFIFSLKKKKKSLLRISKGGGKH